ncbi:MAG: DnaA/Hda family protein [Pseudomonadota bacterium]
MTVRENDWASAESEWSKFLSAVRSSLGDGVFGTWFSDMRLDGRTDDCVAIRVRSKFIAQEIHRRYLDRLAATWRSTIGPLSSIEIRYGERAPEGAVAGDVATEDAVSEPIPEGPPDLLAPIMCDPGFGVVTPLDASARFDTYVVDDENRMAHAASREASMGAAIGNPIYLWGPSGCGKTHLMHAAAHARAEGAALRGEAGRRVLMISADGLVSAYMGAYQDKTVRELKRFLRSADMLLIDDVHFLRGREGSQEEVLNIIDSMAALGKTVMVSGTSAPHVLAQSGLSQRLTSRLEGGLAVPLQTPGLELRFAILQAKMTMAKDQWGFPPIADDVLRMLAVKLRVSARELDGALRVLLLHLREYGGDMSVERAENVLKDQLSVGAGPVSVTEIKDAVSAVFEVPVAEIEGKRRTKRVMRARHATTYLAKTLTHDPYVQIGAAIGGRDHSTVISSVQRAEDLLVADKEFAGLMQRARARLDARA